MTPPSRGPKPLARTWGQCIESIDTHSFQGIVTREKEPHHNDKVGEDEYRPLKVVAFAFTVHVREQKNAENNCYHVPLRKEQAISNQYVPLTALHCTELCGVEFAFESGLLVERKLTWRNGWGVWQVRQIVYEWRWTKPEREFAEDRLEGRRPNRFPLTELCCRSSRRRWHSNKRNTLSASQPSLPIL